MRIPRFSTFVRTSLALVMLAAGLATLADFDRMGHRFAVLGAPDPVRIAAGLFQIIAAGMLMVPGRVGYGAALTLMATLAASLAHATTLGWDSAPPVLGMAGLSGLILWRNRADLQR